MSLVTVTPEEITFPNVLNQEAVFMLKVKNVSSSAAAFKVKTTAPKNYLVKPSAGVIPANGDCEIKITLNKQTSDPSANNDRFLVQAVKTPSGKDLTKEEWQAVDKASVQELRLHVVFSDSAVSAAAPAAVAAISKDATPEQVRAKFDELVTVVSQLEKDKKRLESELDTCKLQLKKKPAAADIKGGFSTIQLIVAMLLAVIIARFATIMGY
jgi:DNA-directed RNA polymerase I, II, and III subunit RPABC2